jgi:hypothetical protein
VRKIAKNRCPPSQNLTRPKSLQRRERGVGVTAFQSFYPQFLTQFIAQVLVLEEQDPMIANIDTTLYRDTETRANTDIVFSPIGPFSEVA